MNVRQETAVRMISRVGSAGLAFLAVLLAASLALAQTGAENIRALVNLWQDVSITDDRRQEFNGRLDALTVDGLDLLVDGKKASVPYLHIVSIDHPTDGPASGALIGLGRRSSAGRQGFVVHARSGCGYSFGRRVSQAEGAPMRQVRRSLGIAPQRIWRSMPSSVVTGRSTGVVVLCTRPWRRPLVAASATQSLRCAGNVMLGRCLQPLEKGARR